MSHAKQANEFGIVQAKTIYLTHVSTKQEHDNLSLSLIIYVKITFLFLWSNIMYDNKHTWLGLQWKELVIEMITKAYMLLFKGIFRTDLLVMNSIFNVQSLNSLEAKSPDGYFKLPIIVCLFRVSCYHNVMST